MVRIEWRGQMAFQAEGDSGGRMIMDAYQDMGGQGLGPTPLETFLMGLGACSAMDVIGILHKKKQKVTGYRIEVDGDREAPGSWPRPYKSITIRHILIGEDIDPTAVHRAIELSDGKYCSVSATLREKPEIRSVWEIQGEAAGK